MKTVGIEGTLATCFMITFLLSSNTIEDAVVSGLSWGNNSTGKTSNKLVYSWQMNELRNSDIWVAIGTYNSTRW